MAREYVLAVFVCLMFELGGRILWHGERVVVFLRFSAVPHTKPAPSCGIRMSALSSLVAAYRTGRCGQVWLVDLVTGQRFSDQRQCPAPVALPTVDFPGSDLY